MNLPRSLMSNLTKIRISAHPWAIETGCYCKSITIVNQRLCKYCKKIVADEIPFLLIFPTYKEFGYFVKNKYPKVVFVIFLFLKKSRGTYKYKNIWHAYTILHRQRHLIYSQLNTPECMLMTHLLSAVFKGVVMQ